MAVLKKKTVKKINRALKKTTDCPTQASGAGA